MLEILLEFVLEVVVEVVGEFVLAFGWESLARVLRRSLRASPIVTLAGWALVGAACGVVSALVVPHRILPPVRPGGASAIIAPPHHRAPDAGNR